MRDKHVDLGAECLRTRVQFPPPPPIHGLLKTTPDDRLRPLKNKALVDYPIIPFRSPMVLIGFCCGTNLPQVAQDDELTARFDTDDCRRFRQHIFSDLSPIAIDLALRYRRTADLLSYDQANQDLLDIHDRLRINDLNLCAKTEKLKETAKRCAGKCRAVRERTQVAESAYQACEKMIEHYVLTPPSVKDDDHAPALNRMREARWWLCIPMKSTTDSNRKTATCSGTNPARF